MSFLFRVEAPTHIIYEAGKDRPVIGAPRYVALFRNQSLKLDEGIMVYLYECKIYTTGRMFAPDLFFYFFCSIVSYRSQPFEV